MVGVSGGPDSVALLHVLYRLSDSLELRLHVAHLHHGIRGTDADDDATFVTEFASTLGLPCTVEQVDVPALAHREKLTLEEAARRARYDFLTRIAQQTESPFIAVGHNADDQAETVLMHFLRGAGLAGLRGMLPVTPMRKYRVSVGIGTSGLTGTPGLTGALPEVPISLAEIFLIRPLLSISRADIEAYCETQALVTRFDHSNLDTTFFRNRLRHEVLPYLQEINPRISQRLQNLAQVVQVDYALLQEFISVAWDELLLAAQPDSRQPDALIFDLIGWRRQSIAVQRAIIRRAAYKLRRKLRDVSFEHVEQAIRVAQKGETGAQATLPRGLRLTVGYTSLTIADQYALHLPPERPWMAGDEYIPLQIPGQTPLPGGWMVNAQVARCWNLDVIADNPNPFVAWIDTEAMDTSPLLRTRRQGDRFQPQGLGGATVRLSDLLINTKVPRPWRDYLPLLEADGHLLWVVGIRLSESALVRPETSKVIYLHFVSP